MTGTLAHVMSNGEICMRALLAMQVDDLDYAIRIKSPEKASEALSAAQSALDTAIGAV